MCDIAFHDPLSFSYPEGESAYDYDKALGAQTRSRTLAWLADSRMRLVSYHAPWPGIGHVARSGAAYRFVPEPTIRSVD